MSLQFKVYSYILFIACKSKSPEVFFNLTFLYKWEAVQTQLVKMPSKSSFMIIYLWTCFEHCNSTWHMQIDISPRNQCNMKRAGERYGFFCFCSGTIINPYRWSGKRGEKGKDERDSRQELLHCTHYSAVKRPTTLTFDLAETIAATTMIKISNLMILGHPHAGLDKKQADVFWVSVPGLLMNSCGCKPEML